MTYSCHRLWIGAALVATLSAGTAHAADLSKLPVKVPSITPWNWTGFYAGVHAGGGLGFSEAGNPYGTSIYGDKIRTPAFMLGGQVGYNWQPAGSPWVFGVEGELSWLDADGTVTCFAPTGEMTSSTCSARPQYTGTLTGRVGYALGPAQRTLVYGKGGAAFLHNRVDATTNFGFGVYPITTTDTSNTSWGWTLGAGVEQALSPAWSLKLEYDYRHFADATLATPSTFTTTPDGNTTNPVAASSTSVRQSMHTVKLGLNYHFGAPVNATWGADSYAAMAAATPRNSGWQVEVGGRYWYSSGRFQKDLPGTNVSSTNLVSRLTYADVTGHSGEVFARIDTPWLVFVKGYAGAGKLTSGRMNDEDWGLTGNNGAPPFTGYSNTLSNLSSTDMNYQTIDVGVSLLQGPAFKLGPFVGYNRVHEQYAATDCAQTASPASGICSVTITNTAVITETDTWQSLRVGAAGDVWLTPRWRLTGDIAYLPYVQFSGVDNHWLRSLVIDESGRGRGVQMEAFVSYYVTPQFSIGVGARYWSMWTTSGIDYFNGSQTSRSDTYRYERFGGLLQASYKFD